MSRFLLEIGTEELPSAPLMRAVQAAQELLVQKLTDARLVPNAGVKVISSPRRIALIAEDVPQKTQATHEVYVGPQVSIAYSEEGSLTKAGEGFLRSKGATEQDVKVELRDGKEYLVVYKDSPSVAACDLLGTIAEEIIKEIPWKRAQRWGSTQDTFGRPIRSLVCLLGSQEIPIHYADVTSSSYIHGHRVLAPKPLKINNADEYEELLHRSYVMGHEQRKELIMQEVRTQEKELNLEAELPDAVLSEVINLCEWPHVMSASFSEGFLGVPEEIITEALLKHQRYFPMRVPDGKLSHTFLLVSNASPEHDVQVREGNERVVRARLDDAQFFFEQDVKDGLANLRTKLKKLEFHDELGTMYDKSERLEKLARFCAQNLGATDEEQALAAEAGKYAKADLASRSVIEFTSQQGVMGGYFARAEKRDKRVAAAIKDQYRPRFSKDEIPRDVVSVAVALADKLDTLVGLFAVGEKPTGSHDPYALRRATLGLIALLDAYPRADVEALLAYAYKLYAFDDDRAKSLADLYDYILARLQGVAKEAGIQPDVIAALGARTINPADYLMRAKSLCVAQKQSPELFQNLTTAYARAAHLIEKSDEHLDTKSTSTQSQNKGEHLLKKQEDRKHNVCQQGEAEAHHINPAKLGEHEAALYTALHDLNLQDLYERQDYDAILKALSSLYDPIAAFFDNVLVMDKDLNLRAQRMAVLQDYYKLFSRFADFDKMARAEKNAS